MHPRVATLLDQASAEARRRGQDLLVGHLVLAAARFGAIDVDVADVRKRLDSASHTDPLMSAANELVELAKTRSAEDFLQGLRSYYTEGPPASGGISTSSEHRSTRIGEAADDQPAGSRDKVVVDFEALGASLSDAVIGQGDAVRRIVDRLALTHKGFDMRPERPNGVFLLLGPTGVGKTHMARCLADSLFGSPDAMVRLDMSEYSHDWAQSRLTGSNPGYVGYSEPDGWLTSKIVAAPRSVLLLDEVEKAHPSIWQTFLQVFDAGSLTDGRGVRADFRDVIILMTSNIGADAFDTKSVGFTSTETNADADVGRALRDRMPPEFINRIDDILVFRPLERDSILNIAARMVGQQAERFSTELGYTLNVPPPVIELLADEGYSPRYGARHLERNIERLLLMPLSRLEPGSYRAKVAGNLVEWHPNGSSDTD